MRSRSNSHPYSIPLGSINYSDAETYKDHYTAAETIQDADTNAIPCKGNQDAFTGTTWEFVDQWTEDSGTDVSDPQRMTCDYFGCGWSSLRAPYYFKDHLNSHSVQIISAAIKNRDFKCTWNPDCEKKPPFNSSKPLQTHIQDIHLNQLAYSKQYTTSRNDHALERRSEVPFQVQDFETGRDTTTTTTSYHKQNPHPPCSSNKSSLKAEHGKHPLEKMTAFDTTASEKRSSLFHSFQLPNHPKKNDTGSVKFSRDRNIGIEHFSEPTNTTRWRKHWTGGDVYTNPIDPYYGR